MIKRFFNECTILTDKATDIVKQKDFHESYKKWCSEKGFIPVTIYTINKYLEDTVRVFRRCINFRLKHITGLEYRKTILCYVGFKLVDSKELSLINTNGDGI